MKSTNYSKSPDNRRQLLIDCRARVRSGADEDREVVLGLMREPVTGIYNEIYIPRIAAAAIISMGSTGVGELKKIARKASRNYHVLGSIVETLWRATTGRRLPDPMLGLDTTDDTIMVDEATQIAAKLALDDLIVQSEEDDVLRNAVFALAAHGQLAGLVYGDSPELPDFGKYVFSVFRASSITLTQDLIDELTRLVDQNLVEQEYQQFLKARPVFLDPLAAEVVSQARLGSDLITDFFLRLHDFRYVVVEIEKPQDSIFTRANDFTAKFTHAVGQVLDFQGWLSENISYARTKLPQIESPGGIVIIGRRRELTSTQEAKLRRWCQNSKGIEVLTFDDLVTRATLLHRSLRVG